MFQYRFGVAWLDLQRTWHTPMVKSLDLISGSISITDTFMVASVMDSLGQSTQLRKTTSTRGSESQLRIIIRRRIVVISLLFRRVTNVDSSKPISAGSTAQDSHSHRQWASIHSTDSRN